MCTHTPLINSSPGIAPSLAWPVDRIVVVRYRMYLESDLWDLEHYLTQRRKDIDRKYDFRSSRLTRVFGRPLREHRVSEKELRGLRKDKLKSIQSCAQFLAEDAEYPAAAAFIPYLGQRWNPLFRESFGARRDRRR